MVACCFLITAGVVKLWLGTVVIDGMCRDGSLGLFWLTCVVMVELCNYICWVARFDLE